VQTDSLPILLIPLLFIPTFALMWLGVTGLLAHLSGWRSLARRFAAPLPIEGECFRFASAGLGPWTFFPVNYSGILFFTINNAGISLSLFLPFRFLSPSLFIPWEEVESVQEKAGLFGRSVVVSIKGSGIKLTVRGRVAVSIVSKRPAGYVP
jgi:hypothetical protein